DDIGQLGLFGGREHTIDFHIVHVLTGIAEVICAEHHHLDRSWGWGRALREKTGAEESNETGGDAKFHRSGLLSSIRRDRGGVWIQFSRLFERQSCIITFRRQKRLILCARWKPRPIGCHGVPMYW